MNQQAYDEEDLAQDEAAEETEEQANLRLKRGGYMTSSFFILFVHVTKCKDLNLNIKVLSKNCRNTY